MPSHHELAVSVVSPEEAEFGTAEFWAGDRLFGFTRIEDGELILRIQPASDGGEVAVNAHSLREALERAKHLLETS
jgi:L-rhamnose isomerase